MKRNFTISGEDKKECLSPFFPSAVFSLGKKNELMLGSFFRIVGVSELWESRLCHGGPWNSPYQDFLMEVDEAPEAACK